MLCPQVWQIPKGDSTIGIQITWYIFFFSFSFSLCQTTFYSPIVNRAIHHPTKFNCEKQIQQNIGIGQCRGNIVFSLARDYPINLDDKIALYFEKIKSRQMNHWFETLLSKFKGIISPKYLEKKNQLSMVYVDLCQLRTVRVSQINKSLN